MLENRRTYRLPFKRKLVFATDNGVYAGNCVNLSLGGVFVNIFTLFKPSPQGRCVFSLHENATPLSIPVTFKRIVGPSSNPDIIPGVGLAFINPGQPEIKELTDFLHTCRRNLELAATILSAGEPDLLSLEPLIDEINLPAFTDLGELKFRVEHILKSIEIVEKTSRGPLSPSL